jgi:hypothetical protein
MESTTPRKGHHRWVDGALERSAIPAGPGAPGPLAAGARRGRRGDADERRGWEEASLAAQTFLLAARGSEELNLLRSRVLEADAPQQEGWAETELKLARAEYEELRAMHLLFVEASSKKVSDLQETCRLRLRELEALHQERAAERKDRDRWASELEHTRLKLAEREVELQMAEEAIRPFLDARERLLEDAKRGQQPLPGSDGEPDEGDKANGLLKKLSRELPMLERALERDEKMRASEKRNVKDKHVVLMALVGETTERAASMCATLRNAASMTQALHALRDVLRYEQTQQAMLLRLRRQIDSRVARCAFYQFVQQVLPHVFVCDACIACIHVFAQLQLCPLVQSGPLCMPLCCVSFLSYGSGK